MSYFGVGSHHKNAIVECRIKELTLDRWTLLLHVTRLWTDAVITLLWPFLFNAECKIYNRLDMDKDGKITEKTSWAWSSKSAQQTTTPGVALYLY